MLSQTRIFSLADRLKCFISDADLAPGMDLEPRFQELATEVFAFQFENNPVYRRFCEGRGVSPGTSVCWKKTPAIPTPAFKQYEVSCLPAAKRTHYFCSSGTTGHEPGRHFHGDDSLKLYEASLERWFKHNIVPDDPRNQNARLLCLTPPASEVPHSSLAYMFNTVANRFQQEEIFAGGAGPAGVWELKRDQILETLERSASGNPLILLGAAFSFVQLLDFLRERSLRFDLPRGSRILETGGYKGRSRVVSRAALYEMMEETLGVPADRIISEYGMSELSSQAYDYRYSVEEFPAQKYPRALRFPPWARVQIVSPETGAEVSIGETGMIRVFDLANLYSVMAIQTEDLGIRREEGFELVGRTSKAEPRGCSLMISA